MEMKTLTQTWVANPSKWEGFTTDNRPVYIKYRNYILSVNIGHIDESITSMLDRTVTEDYVDTQNFCCDPEKVTHKNFMITLELINYLPKFDFVSVCNFSECNRCDNYWHECDSINSMYCLYCGSCQICGCCPCNKPNCERDHI